MKTLTLILLSMFFGTVFNTSDKTGYEVGDYAMDFKLKNVDGEMVSLSDYSDAKGFIITFTCNTCPYAVLYEQRIIDLHESFAAKGFPVIAINPNDPVKQPGDSFEEMKSRAAEKKYPFPYLVDDSQEITRTYGATNTPHMYVLKKDNDKYQVVYIGAIDNNPKEPEKVTKTYIEDAINAVLNNKEVPVKQSKAIGCTIKWKST